MWKWLKRVFPSEHQWAAQQLSAYLDGELSPPDRARVEAHLKECQTCAEELRTLRWTVNLTAQMPMLRAPRSFLIAEAIAQPRRPPLSVAYVYLRGATIAAAALLLVVLVSDFLLPYTLPAGIPVPQKAMRRAVPVVEEVQVEAEWGTPKEVEKLAPPMFAAPPEAEADMKLTAALPALQEEAVKKVELEKVAEQIVEEEVEQEPMILKAPPAERAPERDLGPGGGGAGVEQEIPAEKRVVASAVVTPTPTTARVILTPTPLPPQRTVEMEKVVPSPQPMPLPTAVAVAEVTEPTVRPFPPWRSALRLVEMGLGLLIILLVGSTLIIRARHW